MIYCSAFFNNYLHYKYYFFYLKQHKKNTPTLTSKGAKTIYSLWKTKNWLFNYFSIFKPYDFTVRIHANNVCRFELLSVFDEKEAFLLKFVCQQQFISVCVLKYRAVRLYMINRYIRFQIFGIKLIIRFSKSVYNAVNFYRVVRYGCYVCDWLQVV